MERRNNFSNVWIILPCIFIISINTILILDVINQSFFKLLVYRCVAKHIVDVDACLACIWELSTGTLKGCVVHICVFRHNQWTFASKLKNARNQVFSSCFLNQFSFFSGSSEANQIEWVLADINGNTNISFQHTVKSWIEIVFN
jgi:hypothetical protein